MPDLLHPSEGPDSDDPSPDEPFDPGEFEVAVSADDQLEAQLLLDACEEAGIPALLQSTRSGLVGTIASPVEAFRILVPRSDLGRAVRLLEDRKAALEADPEGAARAADEEESATES